MVVGQGLFYQIFSQFCAVVFSSRAATSSRAAHIAAGILLCQHCKVSPAELNHSNPSQTITEIAMPLTAHLCRTTPHVSSHWEIPLATLFDRVHSVIPTGPPCCMYHIFVSGWLVKSVRCRRCKCTCEFTANIVGTGIPSVVLFEYPRQYVVVLHVFAIGMLYSTILPMLSPFTMLFVLIKRKVAWCPCRSSSVFTVLGRAEQCELVQSQYVHWVHSE